MTAVRDLQNRPVVPSGVAFAPWSRLRHGIENLKGNDFTAWLRGRPYLEAGPDAGLRRCHGSGGSCLANFTRHPLRRGCEDDSDDRGVSP